MSELHILTGSHIRKLTAEASSRLAASLSDEKTAWLIVPDQYTMTAESVYLDALGEPLMGRVRVRTFKRLAAEAEKRNGSTRRVLGKGGKNVLLMRACRDCENELVYYGDCKSVHFAEALSAEISDLKMSRVAPSSLRKTKSDKLSDIAKLYETYRNLLGDRFADPDDRLAAFAASAPQDPLWAGKTVFIDFFKVLNAGEIGAVEALLCAGADVTVTLRLPDDDAGDAVLSPVRAVYDKLCAAAGRVGAKVTRLTVASSYGDEPALKIAEQRLFRARPACALTREGVAFYKASGRSDEVDFVFSRIASLVREEGLRYGDFAIVSRDIGRYEALIDAASDEYGVPVFLHRKSSLRRKLPVRIVTDVLDAVSEASVADELLDLARARVAGITEEEAACFEQYVLTWKFHYLSQFKKPFMRSINGFQDPEEDDDGDRDAQALAESVRVRLTDLLKPFEKEKQTVRAYAESVYKLTEAVGLRDKIEELGKAYAETGETVLYRENRRVYRLMMDTLDELVAADPESELTPREFETILLAAADATELSIIPTSADAVLTGSADVVPLYGQKIVFVIGLCEGEFPAASQGVSLITERDRRALADVDVEVGIGEEDRYYYELFFARFVLTAAERCVYLTYPAVAEGETVPSEIFREMRVLFARTPLYLPPDPDDPATFGDRVQRPAPAFALCASEHLADLDAYFRTTDYARFMSPDTAPYALMPETAEKLFSEHMRLSASKVDTFYQCRFRYFFQYGLALRSDSKAEFNPVNTGKFLHAMFETVMQAPDWLDADDGELLARVKSAADAYFKTIFGEDEPSASFYAYLDNLVARVVRLLKKFREQLRTDSFVPYLFEHPVSDDSDVKPVRIKLDKGSVRLTGVIDRVDVFRKGDEVFLRVVDYKSSGKEFSLGNVYNGIDIQMLMYLHALKANGTELLGNVRPTGAVYVSGSAGIRNVLTESKAKPESGIYARESAEEAGAQGKKDMIYVPDDTLAMLFDHVDFLLKKMGNELHAGHIPCDPYRSSKKDACKYCDYKPFCPNAGRFRETVMPDKDTIADYIKEEGKKDGK